MAFDYEVSVSTVCNSIHWVEDTLVANDKFKFGSEKETQDKVNKEKAAVFKSRQKEKNW